MPSYKVLEQGFFDGKLYSPTGKRRVLHTDNPFPKKGKIEQVPKWLTPLEGKTDAEVKKLKAAEIKASKVASDIKDKADRDIREMSFMGEGESANIVETL